MAGKVWRRGQSGHKAGHKAKARRTHGGQSLRGHHRLKADTGADARRTHGGDMVDKVWSGLKADAWLTQVSHMADARRTRFGGAAKADSRRTQGRREADVARAYDGQLFFLRENLTVNCLGKNLLP